MNRATTATYQNPVYPNTCPDPFVFKYLGEYWCIATGFASDGGVFPILHSPDLITWRELGSAMPPLPGEYTAYWAPEVHFENGIFYLYYAVGDGTSMHLRVATAKNPQGPYNDSGKRLTSQDFAIDAHVFLDEDGRRYLFYATDFLDAPRIGTGTVVDIMVDPLVLAGKPRPVTLAKYDWQDFDPQRAEKGGVKWHTVEGPFVLKHNGRYYQMFSGGNWQNDSYGVCYAFAGQPYQVTEWEQACDGSQTLPLLRSNPAEGIIGPGHNSVVRGPDNHELFIVYHRWRPETNSRVMAIDRLNWEGDRLVAGPTSSPQPAPQQPDISGFASFTVQGEPAGVDQSRLLLSSTGEPVSIRQEIPSTFIMEVSFRLPRLDRDGYVALLLDGRSPAGIRIDRTGIRLQGDPLEKPFGYLNPKTFEYSAYHLLRIEAQNGQSLWWLDGLRVASFPHQEGANQVIFTGQNCTSEWAAFALTALESKPR